MTPIVRIADDSEREILVLAQNFNDMLFGVRTGASALRIRQPIFVFPDVFAAGPNVITVRAGYSAREVWMNARSTPNGSRRIPISAALAWTMLLPFQWLIKGTSIEFAVSAIWTACLLLPLGYWARWTIQLRKPHAATRVGVLALPIAVLLYVGLVGVAQEFGLAAAPLQDWLAALTGILAGSGLSEAMSSILDHHTPV
jgi:hypothetical protein